MISAADNGIGIKADQQLWIYEPFKRLHGKELPGNGIGLAIRKRVVERDGKRIWVAPEEVHGATFTSRSRRDARRAYSAYAGLNVIPTTRDRGV